ncbi:MAG: family 78 glycoside hydrolase catalytic domain [Clostridia bacterium]|nr:family 78 glycoside hydrolase catalytic domain [Clostridia bacterium]
MSINSKEMTKKATFNKEESNHAPGAPYGLLTNESEYPLNIEGAPLFDWWVNDEDADEVQTAYQIRLYDGITDELVWDSGKVESAEQNCVCYGGEPLKHGYPYTWEVKTWDREGAESPFSERAKFATGLDNGEWGAKWIVGVKDRSASVPEPLTEDNSYWYSRKEYKPMGGKTVKRALAYVSGSQDYELLICGTRIGRAQTYDYLGETKYQGWDVTEAVKGRDTLVIGVLTGYFAGGQGRAELSKPGLLAKIIIYYTDGTSECIVTDESWLTHETGYSNLAPRNSEGDEIEMIDANLMLTGWSEVGYDTSDWVPVYCLGAHPCEIFYNLQPELGHVTELKVKPVGVTTLPDGTTVADFGKVIPATVIIHFPSGRSGTRLTIQEGYELNEDGTINTSIQSTQHTNMTYVYVMKDGEQTYEPWGFLGFRYVSVPPEGGVLSLENFEATVYHAELVSGRESTLKTSSEMINEVFELFKRSALYSVQNQFVDTPTREKGQFLVDAVNSSASTTSGSYERQATRKAILQFLDSADRHWTDESVRGMYNAVYPNVEGCRGIPDFSLNLPHLAWRYYMLTGDRVLLERAYPYMKNTADFVTRYINPDTGLVTALPGGGEHRSYSEGIVDSPAGRFGYDWKGTLGGARTTVNALGVRVYDIVVKMAKELGYSEDVKFYCQKASDLRSAMNKKLIAESGVFCDGLTKDGLQSPVTSQHSTSHAITAEVAPRAMWGAMADYIASLGMKQGPMTADTLIDALFKSGRGDAAVRIMTNTEDYGWAKLINEGYTYTWENWQAGSQSHGWGSASLWQMIEYISGVKIIEPGAAVIQINPAIGALDKVDSHTVTARGEVNISYTGKGKDYVLSIEVPPNVTARVVFPVIEGGEFVELGGKCHRSELNDGTQIVTVGSGKRTFKYKEGAEK